MRTNSSAYSGFPPHARGAPPASAGQDRPLEERRDEPRGLLVRRAARARASPRSASRRPSPGRRASSSGRAVQTTRIGTPRPSRPGGRRSRAGRRPPSGGPRRRGRAGAARRSPRGSAARLRMPRPASRRRARSAARPTSGRSALDPARVGCAHEASATTPASFSPRVGRRVGLEDAACAFTISPSAQKATPSPYGSERPWRQ